MTSKHITMSTIITILWYYCSCYNYSAT